MNTNLELICLAHRYLYYVLGTPVISDREYDLLEKEALKTVNENSLLNSPGSDLKSDYSKIVIELATNLIKNKE